MKFEKNELWIVLICIIMVLIGFYFSLKHKNIIITPKEPIKSSIKSSINLEEVSKLITRHEGIRNKVYLDTQGNPTIGIGFNLNNSDSRERIEELGLNFESVFVGFDSLTNKQIKSLFDKDLSNSIKDAISFLPDFDNQPDKVKIVLVDMSFNMGLTRLNQFVKFKDALITKDYKRASKEMKDSRWYNQVGNRSKELAGIMRTI